MAKAPRPWSPRSQSLNARVPLKVHRKRIILSWDHFGERANIASRWVGNQGHGRHLIGTARC
jgi:hypothetical protein